ncbi:(deoxy)nucleoside triphosphate pyrophosphohydrolase [Niallia nealsonii]|uniref:8-oxo-dGTP diphosphatase n=1 Tax=Niallia nealsonii TaxID=115979 RepID=A0A2N0Z5I9_9BACI|nr:(deoxy)nucleoside triphosphate pyrophosphohydrolase [Niallia nealsonii]PKG24757.1 8-oxo-dGTP diphosphatase MutT [Niallia nealsonii]
MKKVINVVAAIIENKQNEILCALRSPQMSLPNRWEFPGGKVEKGEDIFSALKREILEELDCQIKATELFHENTHEYDRFIITLICIKANIIEGTPTASEHSKLVWLKRENLDSLKWAPADIPAVTTLINE